MMNRDALGDGGIPNWEPADSPDPNATILYITNMDPRVSADMMMTIMSSGPGLPGKLLNCKMEASKDGLTCACFVEFADNQSATVAQNFINGRQMHDKKLKVQWASNAGPGLTPKVLSGSVSVYVGDLDESVSDIELQNHFEKALDRKLESVKIVKDVTTGVSKGFGFAVFQNKADAQLAIKLHGQIYKNGRKMKINWASRNKPQSNQKTLEYEEVSSAAKDDNCTVYVGGIPSGIQADDVKRHFEDVAGTLIHDARIFVDKGFAFIKYDTHDSATKVIIEKNGTCIPCTQSCLKCWWGKDGPGSGPGESDQGFRHGPGSRDGGNFRRENNFGQPQQQQHQPHNNQMQQNNSMMSQQPGEQAAPSREQMKMAMGPMFQMNQITGPAQEQMLDHMVKVPSYFQECMQNWMQYVQQCNAMAQQQQAMMAQQQQYAMMAQQQQQHQQAPQAPPQPGPGQQQQFTGQQQQPQQQGGMMMNNNMPHHHGQNF